MTMKFRTLALGLVLALAGAAQASAEIVLRYAEAGPNRGTRADAVQFFADEVERLSGGDIKIDIHWGGALLKWSGVMNGVVYLSNFSTTGVQFECTTGNQILTVDDIKGKRIRATGTYTNVLAELGADTVSMTFGEVYQALDTGLVDCLASYFYTMRAYKTYEVVESVTRVDWGQLLGFAIVINEFRLPGLHRKSAGKFLMPHSSFVIAGLKRPMVVAWLANRFGIAISSC